MQICGGFVAVVVLASLAPRKEHIFFAHQTWKPQFLSVVQFPFDNCHSPFSPTTFFEIGVCVINCAPPFSRQRVDLNVEIESAHGENTEVAVAALSSRGINKFHLESNFIWRVTSVIDYVKKSDEKSVQISSDRARVESVPKCKHAHRDRELSRILYKNASSLFSEGKVIRKI